MIRVALDSNILVYLESAWFTDDDRAKTARSLEVIEALRDRAEIVAPVQSLGELGVVLRRSGVGDERVRETVGKWVAETQTAPSSAQTLITALDLAAEHRLQFWDSLIISAAVEADCALLLSEDMQDGFTVRGLTIVNPLAAKPHSRLARLLED